MDADKRQEKDVRTGPGPVIRVRVQYMDGQWRAVKRVRVSEMTIPASQELPKIRAHRQLAGFWFEAADAQGRVIYRHGLRSPVPGVEIFEEGGRISRASAEIEGYTVELLVPDLPQVKDVRLFFEGPEAPRERGKAAEREPGVPRPVGVFAVREDGGRRPHHKGGEGDGNE
jgi:hypothetical protein